MGRNTKLNGGTEMIELKPVKPVVVWVIYRETKRENYEIMTAWREIQNPGYDPMGITDEVWESGGETLEPDEDELTALIRGIKDELAAPIRPEWIQVRETVLTTKKGGQVIARSPLRYVESVREPHHWKGPAYAVKVPLNWKPDPKKGDGEAKEVKWWSLYELKKAIQTDPDQFMFLHLPAVVELIGQLEHEN
jgi:hypothetical protein